MGFLGLSLLFVGFTLIHNGVCILKKVPPKTMAFVNAVTGTILFVINIVSVANAVKTGAAAEVYAYAAQGLLFAVTYYLLAASLFFGMDFFIVGLYGTFAAVNAAVIAFLTFRMGGSINILMGFLWIAWFVLWGEMFLENILKLPLKKFPAFLLIFEGLFAAWAPALYFLFFM